MYYQSAMPKVVGEFDAERLQAQIDGAAAFVADQTGRPARVGDVVTALHESSGLERPSMTDIAGTAWIPGFHPEWYGRHTTTDRDGLHDIGEEPSGDVDAWHPDGINQVNDASEIFTLPETLTSASKHPTEFLIGHIAIPIDVLMVPRFFKLEVAKAAFAAAIKKGDAYTHHFDPGEELLVPHGTLHRRDIPPDAIGFRYFKRKFAQKEIVRRGSVYGHVRPFKTPLRPRELAWPHSSGGRQSSRSMSSR